MVIMKIIFSNLKENKIKLKPEKLDDLWILKDIIEKGDSVEGYTVRSIDYSGKKEKKKIFVKIEVEKTTFGSDELRVMGLIKEASEDIPHGHHTFEIKMDIPFTLYHNWKKYEIERIKNSSVKPIPVLVCILDDDECDFYSVESRINHIGHFSGTTGKMFSTDNNKYYNEVAKFISGHELSNVIIAGPGFAKEKIKNILKGSEKRIYVDSVSSTGDVGLNEVIKRGLLDKIVQKSLISEETKTIEKFFTELKKDGLVIYGRGETKKALDSGALETLLISDKVLRDNENLLKEAEKMKTEVKIISSHHPSGEQFYNFGGVGGFLRYKLNF